MNATQVPFCQQINSRIEKPFIKKILTPYYEYTNYLKKANLYEEENQGISRLKATGEFSIEDSCYIDDTGHFNAVEFNICYNQLAYVHMAHCIKNQLIPQVAAYDINSFLQKQLSNFLITNISSSYHSMLNANHFYGSYEIKKITKKSKYVFLETSCDFWDDGQGKATGTVNTVIILP